MISFAAQQTTDGVTGQVSKINLLGLPLVLARIQLAEFGTKEDDRLTAAVAVQLTPAIKDITFARTCQPTNENLFFGGRGRGAPDNVSLNDENGPKQKNNSTIPILRTRTEKN